MLRVPANQTELWEEFPDYEPTYVENKPKWPGAESCMHDSCSQCHGTGRNERGQACIHMISCPCPRCSPRMF